MSRRVLIAGIGNIFLGDDAFGVEVARALGQRPQPAGVLVHDFGISGHDLAFALCDGYDAVVFVDATPRGKAPGEVFVLELKIPTAEEASGAAPSGHSLDPVAVLRLAATFGAQVDRLYLVGCEPGSLDPNEAMELSPAVKAAVPRAVEVTERLIATFLETHLPDLPAQTTASPKEDYAHEYR